MLDNLMNWIGSFGNTRSKSLSVPVFDGALKPNNLLEEAEILVEQPGLNDLARRDDGQIFTASANTLYALSKDGALTETMTFDRVISALAFMADGRPVVGLGDRIVLAPGSADERVVDTVKGRKLVAVTAIYRQPDGGLLVCDGSDRHGVDDWAWDLMGKNSGARLIRIDPASGDATVLASGMAYAFGAYDSTETGILVSESWKHCLTSVTGKKKPAVDRLAGYPSRMSLAQGGGFWLSLFCSRTQLVEFVLKEHDFRQEMMATIEPAYWISPSFGSGQDFLEPLQGGGVKQMGVLKPWAPPRSYGLVVRFDANLVPLYSMHSRVGGRNHGICATVQDGDTLYALSKGSGRILKLSVHTVETTLLGGAAQ
ncbi:hypothetical protein SAMN06265173_103173 [Thalassovita litoralis]|jgi:hypothetical protein|uniref:Strictosidine synthase n=1 Tax=Thalassovita litoralis TaxID=1010611 RepID=A0A521BME7_9RHOB|nr:hypothetical protein [Thalassovita litoralis]SMO48308.1 hypothetical protein SAMN06265173_103173 [Thalassovita litoralis]